MNLLQARIAAVESGMAMVELPGFPPFATTTPAAGNRVGETVTIGIRPEHVEISEHGAVSGVVAGVEQLGGLSYIRLDAPDMTVQIQGQTRLGFDDTVHLHLPPHEIHVFDSEGMAMKRSDPQ
jgi:ABC-type sugar transport system ATPase subunit